MLKYLILFCIPYIVYTINVMMQVNNVLSFRKHNRYGSKLKLHGIYAKILTIYCAKLQCFGLNGCRLDPKSTFIERILL